MFFLIFDTHTHIYGFCFDFFVIVNIQPSKVLRYGFRVVPWWRHQMETFSALLALCVGNSPVTGEFPSQRPVTRSCDVLFDLRLNKRLNERSWGWWFETPSHRSWRRSNANATWLQYCPGASHISNQEDNLMALRFREGNLQDVLPFSE